MLDGGISLRISAAAHTSVTQKQFCSILLSSELLFAVSVTNVIDQSTETSVDNFLLTALDINLITRPYSCLLGSKSHCVNWGLHPGKSCRIAAQNWVQLLHLPEHDIQGLLKSIVIKIAFLWS